MTVFTTKPFLLCAALLLASPALLPGSGGWAKPGDADAKQQGLPDVQLYDLATDPGEMKNLHATHPEMVAKLTRLLENYLARGRSTPGAKQSNDVNLALTKKSNPAPK